MQSTLTFRSQIITDFIRAVVYRECEAFGFTVDKLNGRVKIYTAGS